MPSSIDISQVKWDNADSISALFGADADKAKRIIKAESSGDPTARHTNKNGTHDGGLFQINSVHLPELKKAGIIKDEQDLFDPEKNTAAAAYLHHNKGWQPWEASKAKWGEEKPVDKPVAIDPDKVKWDEEPAKPPQEEQTKPKTAAKPPEPTFAQKAAPFVRPLLETGGAMAVGTLAAPFNVIAPGVSEALGVAGGYLAGKYAADLYDETIARTKKPPTPKEAVSNFLTKDAPEALMIGGTGPVIGKLGSTAKFGMENVGPTAAGARSAAAKQIAKATSAGSIYVDNARAAQEIEARIPGLKFTRGQLTNDPQAIMLQRALERSDTEAAGFSQEQRAFANDALQRYYQSHLTGGQYGIEDFLSTVRGQQTGLETNVEQLQGTVDAKVAELGKAMPVQETGATLTKEAREARTETKAKATALFNEIPTDVTVKTQPLYDAIQGVEKDFNPNVEDPANHPSRLINGIMKEIEEAPAAPSKLVDAKGQPITRAKEPKYIPPPYQATAERYSSGGGYVVRTGPNSFQKSMNGEAWYRTEEEAQRNATALNKRNMKAFDEQNQQLKAQWEKDEARIKEGANPKLKDLSFKDLTKLRSTVLADLRTARASANPNARLISRLNKIREGVDATIDQLAKKPGAVGQKYRQAAKFYREEYVQKYRQGAVADILQAGSRGEETRIATANIAQKFFTKDGADQFVKSIGSKPAARQAMRDYAAYDLLNTAVDPATGQLNPGRVYRWYSHNREVLSKLGLEKEFDSVVKIQRAVDNARGTLTVFNKSVASRVLGAEPEKVIANAFGGAGSKNTAQVAKDLLGLAKGNKAAEEGLRKAFADYFYQKSVTTAVDRMGNPVISVAQMTRVLRENAPAIREIYKGQPGKLQALADIRNAYEILDRTAKSPLGGGSDTAENILTVLGKATEPVLGRSRIINTARIAYRYLKGMKDQDVNKLVIRAAFDPDFAEGLIMAARGKAAKSVIEAGTKKALALKPAPNLKGLAAGYGATKAWNVLTQGDQR
jgi:hypothetical protein